MTTHTHPIRVYYEDTDAGGIVYHANYVKFAERGRTEFLRASGYDHQRLANESGISLVVRHMEVDFRASARLDNLLEIESRIEKIGNSSLLMIQTITHAGKILAELKVTVVAITAEGKAVRLPASLRQIFHTE